MYAELYCLSNFSFLRGASHPEELVTRAADLGYSALALTDECSLAGVVRAHVAAKARGLKLLVGSEIRLADTSATLVLIAPDAAAYCDLCALVTLGRGRAPKGRYHLESGDLCAHGEHLLALWLPEADDAAEALLAERLSTVFRERLWIGVSHWHDGLDPARRALRERLARRWSLPLLACGATLMHEPGRQPLLDVLTAIRLNTPVQSLGRHLSGNAERHLRSTEVLAELFPAEWLQQTLALAERCTFSLDSLRYQYPRELVPAGLDAMTHLRQLVAAGAARRWPGGVPAQAEAQLAHELALIESLDYPYYFLTVHDLVNFARSRGILCQGRGSAANSVVCYCLYITNVDPGQTQLLFERFISRERREPPDIDVDFEHERREEVVQYIYRKYGRERAALTATLITYRRRSAIRDVGRALGIDPLFLRQLSRSLAWWDRSQDLAQRFEAVGLQRESPLAGHFLHLLQEILGFPRHLSQHVGGFVISETPLHQLVPVENAAMPGRTIIQWDKQDIEALGLLKVDVLALGMLTALRKCFDLINTGREKSEAVLSLDNLPQGDEATYAMLSRADSIGVFQVESRAQMSMLPRLRPRNYYDLVIEVAIVRPGPIQGGMVHPYLRRRNGEEPVDYPNEAVRNVLERTLGIPIFQEQVIRLAMVAAGFSAGEADQLRRAMASWGRNSSLLSFRDRLVDGMLARGHDRDFAERLFSQMKGFGSYGFPESHAASFALLVYASAWLKCHHPAAFCCALLNSLPMGFYAPSQLIQDARRHGVEVRPVDVDHSHWEHTLEQGEGLPALRLGLRLVNGLSRQGGERLLASRAGAGFSQLAELQARAGLARDDLNALLRAGAMPRLVPHRHQGHWRAAAIETERPLLPARVAQLDDGVRLSAPDLVSDVLADYAATGLSLVQHPLALLRQHPPFRDCRRAADLAALNHRRFLRVAGLVTCRQRPGTASGVLFLTLEDETGAINVVVWRDIQERCRDALLTSSLLLVKGVLENREGVQHVVAAHIEGHDHALAEARFISRDFH